MHWLLCALDLDKASPAGEGSAVPATLKDSLMARLDRLAGAREMAQIAAVIGRHSRS